MSLAYYRESHHKAGAFCASRGLDVSVRVMTRVWDESKQEDNYRLLLLAIADNANDDGVAWPGLEHLQNKILKSESQTRRIRDVLIQSREVYYATAVGRGNKCCYFVMTGLGRERIEKVLIEYFGIPSEKVSSEADLILARPIKGVSNTSKKVSSERLKGVITERESGTTVEPYTEPYLDSSFTNVQEESLADRSKALEPEYDDIQSKALDAYKQQHAVAALSLPECEGEIAAPPAAPPPPMGERPEWFRKMQADCQLPDGPKREAAKEADRGLYTPGEVQVHRGRVAIADADGNMRPAPKERTPVNTLHAWMNELAGESVNGHPVALPQQDPPIGYEWLYSTGSRAIVHLIKAHSDYAKARTLCKKSVVARIYYNEFLACVTRPPCPDCLRLAAEASAPKAPKQRKATEPRPRDPVFDVIASVYHKLDKVPAKSGKWIGAETAIVRGCQPDGMTDEQLVLDLKALPAWYKIHHPKMDLPKKGEKICGYLKEMRDNLHNTGNGKVGHYEEKEVQPGIWKNVWVKHEQPV